MVWSRIKNGQHQTAVSCSTHEGGWTAEQRPTEGKMERWSVGGHQGWRTGVFSHTSLGEGKGRFSPIVVTSQMDRTDNDDKTTDEHNMHR